MPKYEVEVIREVVETITVTVEGESEDDAGEKAVARSLEIHLNKWQSAVVVHEAGNIKEVSR